MPHLAGGYCCAHYARARHGKELLLPLKRKYRDQPQCSIEGCERSTEAHGWCALHYKRWRSNGDPLKTRSTRGQVRSAEHRAKLSAAIAGRVLSPAHRAAIGRGLQGKPRSAVSVEKTSGSNHYRWNGGQPRNLCKREWRKLREQVISRAGYQCERCAASHRTLIAHHVVPYDEGGPDRLENLVCWCRPCHARHHNRETINRPALLTGMA